MPNTKTRSKAAATPPAPSQAKAQFKDQDQALVRRGLLYGEGLFETLRVEQNLAVRLNAHRARISASAAVLGLPAPPSSEVSGFSPARDPAALRRDSVSESGADTAGGLVSAAPLNRSTPRWPPSERGR